MRAFLDELRRRKVVRAALVYGATAFVVLQLADILAPALRLPDWTMTLIVLLLALGFPVALVLAWAFDLTGEGVQRAIEEPAAATQHAWLGSRTVIVVAGLVIFGIGLGAGWSFQSSPPSHARADTPTALAVLPFENLSGDEATAPFVAGLHDDLLTRLSGVGALRVIARASVRQYAEGAKPIRLIAQELGVYMVLAGGVQRLGDRVRINVQLVDGASEQQLWAERFDRDLTAADLFAIQTEITEAIARALSTRLTDAERSALGRRPTDNLLAYEWFLRGRAAFEQAHLGGKDHREAIAFFRRATEEDPRFAQAWAHLAATWMHDYYWRNVDEVAPAIDAVRRARAIDPELPEAYLAQALIHLYGMLDLHAALAELSAVTQGRAGSAEVLRIRAELLSRLGRSEEAIESALQAVALDPRSPATASRVALYLRGAGRYSEAIALIDGALALSPRSITLHLSAADLLASAGDWEAAKRRMREGFQAVPGGVAQLVDALLPRLDWIDNPHQLAYLFELDEFREALGRASLTESYEASSYQLAKARLHSQLGRADLARAHYDSARVAAATGVAEQRRVGRPQVQYYLPQLAFAYAGLGRFEEAIATAEEAVRMRPLSQDRWEGEYLLGVLAAVLVLAGEHDRASEILEGIIGRPGHATAVEPITPGLLRHVPLWAPLRSHPRFVRLLEDEPAT